MTEQSVLEDKIEVSGLVTGLGFSEFKDWTGRIVFVLEDPDERYIIMSPSMLQKYGSWGYTSAKGPGNYYGLYALLDAAKHQNEEVFVRGIKRDDGAYNMDYIRFSRGEEYTITSKGANKK